MEYITAIRALKNIKYPLKKLCIDNTPEVVILKRLKLVSIGQGEGETK
jgi:hypothetical protein